MASDLATELLGASRAADRITKRSPTWWAPNGRSISFTIEGEPASKANSRKPAFIGKGEKRRMLWIKGDKARVYEKAAYPQVPAQWPLLTGPVYVEMTIWYANERSDLDESLILDIMQGRIYVNDRQVRDKRIRHGIDPARPRAEITVQPLVAQQTPLF